MLFKSNILLTMKNKKIWFIGFTSRLWLPISIEGWVISALFFIGILLIGFINNIPNDTSLPFIKVVLILIEFFSLLVTFYFITKGHVDKRY